MPGRLGEGDTFPLIGDLVGQPSQRVGRGGVFGGVELKPVVGALRLEPHLAALVALHGAAVLTLTCVVTPASVARIGTRAALITCHFLITAGAASAGAHQHFHRHRLVRGIHRHGRSPSSQPRAFSQE
jgi:hypothetical protein